ncbi:hypothetical protein Scep_022166 [Stephania cephalantha]|uniref:Helitron helicase-like domain-containing protein n=1 Tax=Stephania cephalantha TaxID=152367 RepID=A0AAP0F7I2_9MAGN
MYIYDTQNEIEHRHQERNITRPSLLHKLKLILDAHNPYVQVFRQLGRREDVMNFRLLIQEVRVNRHIHALPSTPQVATILIGNDSLEDLRERDIIIETKSGSLRNIADTAAYYDPLQYPLLFPLGQHGWHLELCNSNHRRISCRQYYSYVLQFRPLRMSLLHYSGRLLQQYVVDMYVKIETMRLQYRKTNQHIIRSELYQGLQDATNSGETTAGNIGRRIILPSSYTGSPRDMYNRYQDAMAIVRRYGKPDLFITITCNTNWLEITQNYYMDKRLEIDPT